MTTDQPAGRNRAAPTAIRVVCVDMAGTVVSDDGAVELAFTQAVARVGLVAGTPLFVQALQIVHDTMGQSKIDVFRTILTDEPRAQAANAAFEECYAELITQGRITALPGAGETLSWLRSNGYRTCLTTGFAPPTRNALLAQLGWAGLVDLALTPADVARGRPWPDMILRAAAELGPVAGSQIAVVGDTVSDMQAGRAAEAALVIGVLTGAGDRAGLLASGAHEVVDSISDLVPRLQA